MIVTATNHTQRGTFTEGSCDQVTSILSRQATTQLDDLLPDDTTAGLSMLESWQTTLLPAVRRLWNAFTIVRPSPPGNDSRVKGYSWATLNSIGPSDHPWPGFDRKWAYLPLLPSSSAAEWEVQSVGTDGNKGRLLDVRRAVTRNGGPFDRDVSPNLAFTRTRGYAGAVLQGEHLTQDLAPARN